MNILKFITNIFSKKPVTPIRNGINITQYIPSALARVFERECGRKMTKKEFEDMKSLILNRPVNLDTPSHIDDPEITKALQENKEDHIQGYAYCCIGCYRNICHTRLISSLDRHFSLFSQSYNDLINNINEPRFLACVEKAINEQNEYDLFSEIPNPEFIINLVKAPSSYNIQEIYDWHINRINSKMNHLKQS